MDCAAASRQSSASAPVLSPVSSPSLQRRALSARAGSMAIGVAGRRALLLGRDDGLKRMLGADDALDCFGVHWCRRNRRRAAHRRVRDLRVHGGTAGLIEGNAGAQMINQVQGMLS